MPTVDQLLVHYQRSSSQDERAIIARHLLREASRGVNALTALSTIVNDENDSDVRLDIVRYLASTGSPQVVRTLVKEMFDPDSRVRAQAALGVGAYEDPTILAGSIACILDALQDGVTRSYAARALRTVTGLTPDKITHSDRERVRRGETAETVWPDNFIREH